MDRKNLSAHPGVARVAMTAINAQADGAAKIDMTASKDICITCHENEVPPFVETELERLYGHIFSSLAHFRTYGNLAANISTYVVRRNNTIAALFLFRQEKGKVEVLNEGIRIEEEEIRRFADYIFSRYGAANVVTFHAIQTEIRKLPYPHQQFNCSLDIVATLPDSREKYLANLGKSTRSYIHRYENKFRRTFQSSHLEVHERQDIDEKDILDIIQLNRARMAEKDKVSSNDELETQRIIALAKECGLVGLVRINGRICAGVVCYRIGMNYFMPVIAHDTEYNDYRLGTICCFLTICECLARGCRQFHFLWGQYDYKYRLGGVQRDLDHVIVYRSRMRLVRHGGLALKTAIDGYRYQTRQWLLYKVKHQAQDSLAARIAIRLLNTQRGLKRMIAGRAPGQD